MTANLPTVTEPIAGSLTASVNWRRWFQRVQQALQDGTLSTEGLEADIAAIATALGSPDGTVENIPGGFLPADTNILGPASVAVTGSLADGAVVLQLAGDSSAPATSSYYGTDSAGAKGFHPFSSVGAIGCTFDGGSNGLGARQVLEVGAACDVVVPFGCTITAATVVADQTGSLVVSVWSDAYASYPPTGADTIVASAPPTLSSADKSRDTTLTGWTTAIPAGSTVRFTVASVTDITRAAVTLEVTKS